MPRSEKIATVGQSIEKGAGLLSEAAWLACREFGVTEEAAAPEATQEAALRDPADQPVLATWRAANARYLITGDKNLLALAATYPILTPADFWARHGQ